MFELDGNECGDEWGSIVVIYNANRHDVEIAMPTQGEWSIVVAGRQAGTSPLDDAAYMVTGEEDDDVRVRVPAISAMVLHS